MNAEYRLTRETAPERGALRLFADACETLVLVRQGAGACRWEGGGAAVGTECLVLLRAGCAAELRRTGEAPLEIWRLTLTRRLLRELSDSETNLSAAFDAAPRPCAVARLFAQSAALLQRQLMLLEAEAADGAGFGASVMKRALLELILVRALREGAAETQRAALVGRRRLAVEEVFSFISAHLDESLTLESLAARFYVSPEHLARQFKKQTGQTLHQYVLRARLARCRSLLCDGVPLAAIWPQCGFSGYGTMLRAFRRHFGVSPSEYYRRCRARALAETGAPDSP